MFYTGTANNLAFSTTGVARLTIVAATQITTTLPIRGQNGSVTAPAFSFSNNTNMGMYRIATDTLGISTPTSGSGVERIRVQLPSTTVGAVRITVPAINNNRPMEFFNGTANVGNIATTSTTTQYNTSSDYRLKENLRPINDALDKIIKLNPVKFTWKSNQTESEGFLAHELQEFFPDAVSGTKDQTEDYGNILNENNDIVLEDVPRPETLEEGQH